MLDGDPNREGEMMIDGDNVHINEGGDYGGI
jgi:hypothetical protein